MCGRYLIHKTQGFADKRHLRALIAELERTGEFRETWNAAPGKRLPVFVLDEETGELQARQMLWGLLPHWATDQRIAWKLINARSETVATKPAFRDSFRQRRCLVPATGFYEWITTPDGKVPQRFTIDGDLFVMAGLWSSWLDPVTRQPRETFSILTTTPNELVAPVHDRMPVILPDGADLLWLEPGAPARALEQLLVPHPAEGMRQHVASPKVNSSRNDGPDLIVA